MNAEKIIKSNQEQAVASWINYLNQVRLDRFAKALAEEELNLDEALKKINWSLDKISKDVINNGKGRGGTNGMHGFIAEIAECGIGNARNLIEGELPIYQLIDDNGPVDFIRGAQLVQMKFSEAGGHLSLQAIKQHFHQYPDFLNNEGIYQIPSDHYEKIKWLLSISEHDANRMSTSTGEFSLAQWKEVRYFFSNGDISLKSIEPALVEYKDVQANTYEYTFELEKDSLKERNQERKNQAHHESKPSLQEGAKATLAAAFIEGGMTLSIGIVKKIRSGKKLKDFNENDWIEILGDSGMGFAKGGVRGASIYMLTNFTATPAAVANSIVTASFGVAEQAYLLRTGQIDELTFINNAEIVCLDVTISALSSFAGQAIIPIPILGAVIGNTVGVLMYQVAKDGLSRREQNLLKSYAESVKQLDQDLQKQYQAYIDAIAKDMAIFVELLDIAFSPNIMLAFEGSIKLAQEIGVPREEILDSTEKRKAYFMN